MTSAGISILKYGIYDKERGEWINKRQLRAKTKEEYKNSEQDTRAIFDDRETAKQAADSLMEIADTYIIVKMIRFVSVDDENEQKSEQACQRRYPVHLLNKCKKSVENEQEIVKCPYCGIPITGDESTMIITTSTGTKWHYECAMEKYHELRGNEL